MKKAMISLPMANKTEEMKEQCVKNIPLCFLAKSLEAMSKCDTVYFCHGWSGDCGKR